MKKTGKFLMAAFGAILFAACVKEIPTEVRIGAEQLNIEGKTAGVVHADTADIVLMRDSIADEETGLYTVRTYVTLVLDSVYPTDQVEDTLRLQFASADGKALGTLLPTDSLINDSLIAYLQKGVGMARIVDFEGQMSGKDILALQENPQLSFKGFSFVFADPSITKDLNEYEALLKGLKEFLKEAGDYQKSATNSINAGFGGFIYAMVIGKVLDKAEVLDRRLTAKKDRMSPLQLVRFESYRKEMQSFK